MPVTNPAILNQIHLTGESPCASFRPHPLKANFCVECSRLINRHTPEAIPDDECLLKALEYSQSGEKVPSCIVSSDQPSGWGALYHGGFKAVMNEDFLKKVNITHVVNTAKGLEIFGPRYTAAVQKARTELGLSFLELNWDDSTSFEIPLDDFTRCAKFIHQGRSEGGSVLVHCAQGKSRSATAVISYIMSSEGKSFEESLHLVQSQRKMAEPNPTFTRNLKEFEKSTELQDLRRTLAS